MARVTLEKGKLAYENAALARKLAEAEEVNAELQAQLLASQQRLPGEVCGVMSAPVCPRSHSFGSSEIPHTRILCFSFCFG